MPLEDAISSGSIGSVISIERIREDDCFPNIEGEDDDDKKTKIP